MTIVMQEPKVDVAALRKKVGMVFQKANTFPASIYDNIAYGPRTHGIRSKIEYGKKEQIFNNPQREKTKAYVSGQFG